MNLPPRKVPLQNPDDLPFDPPDEVGPLSVPGLDFLEYETSTGEKYRVERGVDLIADFQLADSGNDVSQALRKFHSALCMQEPAWTIICRLYGNAPLYGVEDANELRAWTIAELAEKRNIEPREIDSYVEAAKTFWKRWQLDQEEGPGPSRLRPAPDDETAGQILLENGFANIEDPDERKYVASRCRDLADWLDNDQLRSSARGLIQQEVSIFFILEPTVRELRAEIRHKLTDKKPGSKADVTKENGQLLSLLEELRDAHDSLNGTMKTLGLDDAKGGGLRKKIAFQGCISDLIKAMQEYRSLGNRELIDGLHTAAEVELLLTPTTLRPAQYRPDLVVSLWDARQHLWEADWSPDPISRRACRKLAKGFALGVLEARSEEGEVADQEVTDEEAGLDVGPNAPVSAAGPLEAPASMPISPPPMASRSKRDENAAMIT